MGRLLGWVGALFTCVYLITLAWLTRGRWADVSTLHLNELGDFLAGAFGPLAILWLVLGYFQQGIELRQNSKALHMQAEELRNSVEQQEELVSAARETLQFQHEAAEKMDRLQRDSLRPKFVQQKSSYMKIEYVRATSFEEFILEAEIINLGNRCSQIRIQSSSSELDCRTSNRFVPTDTVFTISCRAHIGSEAIASSKLILHCSDAAGQPYSEEMHILPLDDEEKPFVLVLDSYYKNHPRDML